MYNMKSKIDVDHLISTMKGVISTKHTCTFKGKEDTYMYFGPDDRSYYSSTWQNETYFISLALPDGYDYYISYWKGTDRCVISLSHPDFPFEDDYEAGRSVHAKFFASEEEHFQASLMSQRVNYPYELLTLIEELTEVLKGEYHELASSI